LGKDNNLVRLVGLVILVALVYWGIFVELVIFG